MNFLANIFSSNFEAGQVLQMTPGYHTTKPYYVEVVFYNAEAKDGEVKMITRIPGEHSLDMKVGSNWEYHYKRMKIIGSKKQFKHLLHNQKLI